MNLRNPYEELVRDMNYDELRNYVFDLEREVYKLRRKSRIHRKSMREMQAKLEKNNLILSHRTPGMRFAPVSYAEWWKSQHAAKATCDTE